MRRGTQPVDGPPPFEVPADPNMTAAAGYRPPATGNTGTPALPAKDVKKDRPEVLRMLGTDVVFFRDKEGRGAGPPGPVSPPLGLPVHGALLFQGVPDLPLPRRHLSTATAIASPSSPRAPTPR